MTSKCGHDTIPFPFGQVLIQAREQRGITQYRLAKLMRRDRRWLNLLEHGKREPRATTIIDIAKALDMDPGELIRNLAVLLEKSTSESGNSE